MREQRRPEVSLSCNWERGRTGWGGVYHELGVLGPRIGVEGDEEVLFSHGLLSGAWRGSRGGRGGGVHRGWIFVSSGMK